MTEQLTSLHVNRAISQAWEKLEKAVQQKLDRVLSGEDELTASTSTAVVRFIEASKQFAEDQDRIRYVQASMKHTELPTFDDDPNETEDSVFKTGIEKPRKTRKTKE